MKKVLIVNGPNLNMLGKREKEHYGSYTLEEINNMIKKIPGLEYDFFQSNHEGFLLDRLQEANYDALIINPGSLTHTSIALRDCLSVIDAIKVEVHLSDVSSRESFRKINYIKDVCDISFVGLKEQSYLKAVEYIKEK